MATDTKKKGLTFNDIFTRSMLFRAIPLSGIKGKMLCDIVMLQVEYDKVIEEFNSRMEEGLKRLKKEKFPKFDEEAQKAESERAGDFDTWRKELTEMYNDMRMHEALKKSDKVPQAKFTKEMFDTICETGIPAEYLSLPNAPDSRIPASELLCALAKIAHGS